MTLRAPAVRHSWHDAYDAQMALWRWYRSEVGIRWQQASFADNARGLFPETRAMLETLYANEFSRLLDCDPIYVRADMCELIDHARHDFAPEPLMEMDLITPRGFLYYEQPFVIPDRFDTPTTIKAVSWTRMFKGADDPEAADRIRAAATAAGMEAVEMGLGTRLEYDGAPDNVEEFMMAHGAEAHGVALTLYSDTSAELRTRKLAEALESVGGGWFPPVVPLHLTPWYYGMTFDGNQWDELGKPTGAEWWWRIVQTTLRLMLQRISTKSHARPDRASRREAAKLGIRPDTEVVVVTLRREAHERKEPSGDKANYSHRFLRTGHWRNQWYPSQQVHRQIYIDPTIVGDESLPLLIRPRRVFQWRR